MAVRFHKALVAAAIGALAVGAALVADASADNAGQIGAWGEYGTADGQLANPKIFGAEPNGSVYVGDQPNGYNSLRIQKFSASGTLEGSVDIATESEEVFQGIAVDPEKGRFYLLRDHEGSDPVTGAAPAETILVYSTTPDASGTLVQPEPGVGPSSLPVPKDEQTIDNPTELALDPATGDLEILGTSRAGLPVLQRIGTSGNGTIGARYEEAPGSPFLSSDENAIALAPDGTTYILERTTAEGQAVGRLYTLPPSLSGTPAAVPGFASASERPPVIGRVGSGLNGNGAQIALSADGDTLFYKQELPFTTGAAPGSFQAFGYDLADGSANALYGGATTAATCSIQSVSAGLAPVGSDLFVLDQGPEEVGAPAYGDRVLHFGPGGSGCPAPTAATTLRTAAGEVSSVPPGTSVTLDGTASALGEWGEKFLSATWIVEGPGGKFEETVAGRLTLEHAFDAEGEYTVRLAVKVKLNAAAPGFEPTVYNAAPQALEVAAGGVTTKPTISGLAPMTGPAAGGNTVTISGARLEGATAVKFGGSAATDVKVVDAGTVTATAPAGSAGAVVDVSVTTPGGTSVRSDADQYTYESGPTGPLVTAVSPPSGPAAGGNLVTITGNELDGATGVKFGSAAATDVTPVGPGTVTARVPHGAPGTVVDVVVDTAAGPTSFGAGDRYKYEILTQELGVVKVGSGAGTVTSNRAGISCGASCSASFPQAATVVLLAAPAPGSTFVGWGGACSGQGPCAVGMTGAKTVTASFEAAKGAPAGSAAGAPPSAKPAPGAPSKAPKCKAGSRSKTVAGKRRCVKKKASHERHGKRKKQGKHKRGGKHHSQGR